MAVAPPASPRLALAANAWWLYLGAMTVLTVAYLLVGLAKLVTIIIVLIFFTARAGIRRLLDAKSGSDDETEEYDLGYPSYYGRSSERLTRDAFDARWQRERDLRVAERRRYRSEGGPSHASTASSGERHVDQRVHESAR